TLRAAPTVGHRTRVALQRGPVPESIPDGTSFQTCPAASAAASTGADSWSDDPRYGVARALLLSHDSIDQLDNHGPQAHRHGAAAVHHASASTSHHRDTAESLLLGRRARATVALSALRSLWLLQASSGTDLQSMPLEPMGASGDERPRHPLCAHRRA